MKITNHEVKVDGIDKILLNGLIQNARVSIVELSKKSGISGAAVHQRLKKLENSSLISGSQININPKRKTASGQSRLHYSPGIPLRMNVIKPKKNEAFILLKKRGTYLSSYFYLSKKNNLKEAAKNLYSCLRKIKNKGYKSIAVEKIRSTGIGQSINDRLVRASKF